MEEIECPDCSFVFDSVLWEDVQCPVCGKLGYWDEMGIDFVDGEPEDFYPYVEWLKVSAI